VSALLYNIHNRLSNLLDKFMTGLGHLLQGTHMSISCREPCCTHQPFRQLRACGTPACCGQGRETDRRLQATTHGSVVQSKPARAATPCRSR